MLSLWFQVSGGAIVEDAQIVSVCESLNDVTSGVIVEIMQNADNRWKNICMDWIGLNLIDDATCPSGHIELGLGCHMYIDNTDKVIRGILNCETYEVINGLFKCLLLTMVRRIDVWVGLDRIW